LIGDLPSVQVMVVATPSVTTDGIETENIAAAPEARAKARIKMIGYFILTVTSQAR
jgi:hypothetical protein